jgi:hypothetical protein
LRHTRAKGVGIGVNRIDTRVKRAATREELGRLHGLTLRERESVCVCVCVWGGGEGGGEEGGGGGGGMSACVWGK